MTLAKRALALDRRTLVTALVVVLVASIVIADPALADPANPNNGPGKGLGEMLQGWAQWMLIGVAAIVGVPVVARHDVGMAISLLIVCVVVGIFAFMDAGQFKNFVEPVLESITGE